MSIEAKATTGAPPFSCKKTVPVPVGPLARGGLC